MSDRVSLAGGLVFGSIGIFLLAQLDVPVIRDGGIRAVFGALELLSAVSLLSVALGLSARERNRH